MAFVIVAAQVAVAVGAVGSIYGQVQAGKAQQQELNRQAEEEKIAAEAAELKRREELNRQLAAQNVALAAGGIGMEGTPASIALESAKSISQSEGMISLSEKLRRAQLRRQGVAAKKAGQLGALSSAVSLAMGSGLMGAGSSGVGSSSGSSSGTSSGSSSGTSGGSSGGGSSSGTPNAE
jgi:uncharacterized membrane protein YgcG